MLEELFSYVLSHLQQFPSWLSSVLLLLMISFYLATSPAIKSLFIQARKFTDNGNLYPITKQENDMEAGNPNQATVWISDDGKRLHCKTINIGIWNMLTLPSLTIAHSLGSSFKNIISISMSIISDDQTSVHYGSTNIYHSNAVSADAGIQSIDTMWIFMVARDTGFFHQAAFSNGGFNRGFIHIIYTE